MSTVTPNHRPGILLAGLLSTIAAFAACILVHTTAAEAMLARGGDTGQTARPSLQLAAERAVGRQKACMVALDPRTGRILAMVNEDMACRKAYPPGSVFKLLTAFAGLEEHAISPESEVECRNFYKSGDKTLICSLPGGHGKVALVDAISLSCNVYFYRLGERLGSNQLLKYFRAFGLGSKFGEYPPGQNSGVLPTLLLGKPKVAKAAIGQHARLRVTALQMAVITAAIANGGIEYRPHATGHDRPVVLRRIHGRRQTFQAIRSGMRMAVVEGTAKKALVPGLSVCGKTGSPEVESDPEARHAWFVGFAPFERPEIALVVLVERGHGGLTAAPLARKVFQAYRDMAKE